MEKEKKVGKLKVELRVDKDDFERIIKLLEKRGYNTKKSVTLII